MTHVMSHKDTTSPDGLFVKFNDIPKSVDDRQLAQFIMEGVSVTIYKKESSDVYLNFKKVAEPYKSFKDIPGRVLEQYDMFFKLDQGDPNAKIKIYTNLLPVLFVYLMEGDQSIIDIYGTKFELKDIMKDLEDNIPINIVDEEKPEHPVYGKRLYTVFGNYTFLPVTQ